MRSAPPVPLRETIMEFTTKITIPKSQIPIDYNSKIISFGSCFAENIGKKFQYNKFQGVINPFGILFYPAAIEKMVSSALSEKIYTEKDIFFHNERWHCFDVHSDFSHHNKENVLKNLNEALQITRKNLSEATHCIITLGTAWAYRYTKTETLVANCHKVPQKEFNKELLSVSDIQKSLQGIIDRVKQIKPDIQFIFTISPVRHLKDGFVENQRSKSHLVSALHEFLSTLSSTSPGGGVGGGDYYFPSFEIQMDELRDYRFYEDDMVHPTQVAIDYIWERFAACFFSEETMQILKEVDSIQKGLAHKPFDKKSNAHREFLERIDDKIKSLQKRFDHMDFR